MSSGVEVVPGVSKVVTERITDDPEFARRVQWIEWDSGWRGSGLRVGDRVVADQAGSYTAESDGRGAAFGAYGEAERFAALGLGAGDPVTVHVERAGQRHVLTGRLDAPSGTLRDAEGRPILGPGGPVRYDKDGFDYDWQAWYRQLQDLAQTVLSGWDYTIGYDTARLREQILPFGERVAFLERTYPGPFARAAREDYDAMLAMVAGERRELAPGALEYRQLGAQRAVQVSTAADAAYRAMLAEFADRMVAEPFPAPDPFADDISGWVGRVVALPEIGDHDLVLEVKRSWYCVRGGSGVYLLDRHAEAMRPLWTGLGEYVEQVAPGLERRRLAFVGEVEPLPALVSDLRRGNAEVGLRVKPLGALVTDADDASRRVFVDLRPGHEQFAGARELVTLERPALDPTVGPAEVLRAFFECLMLADFDRWRGFFATWLVREWFERDGSYLYVDQSWVTVSDRDAAGQWDLGRQRVLDDVYAVEVAEVGPVRVVFDASAQPAHGSGLGPRRVEQVQARVNHVGKVDGEHRTYAGYNLHRTWTLQRLDDGPWRVTNAWAI